MKQNLAAGLLMYTDANGTLQYFLVHPGGPYFTKKDAGVWSIPKGIPEEGEDLMQAAQREFFEETGIRALEPFHDIGTVRQKGGKVVQAWAFEGSWDPGSGITCNNFSLEWPPRSGRMMEFPEVDKARWMPYEEAINMINPAQIPFLDRLKHVMEAGRLL